MRYAISLEWAHIVAVSAFATLSGSEFRAFVAAEYRGLSAHRLLNAWKRIGGE